MLFPYRTSLLCLNWSIRFCVFKAIYVNSTFLRVHLLQDALGTINESNIWFNLFLRCHAGSKSCVRYFCSSQRVIYVTFCLISMIVFTYAIPLRNFMRDIHICVPLHNAFCLYFEFSISKFMNILSKIFRLNSNFYQEIEFQ